MSRIEQVIEEIEAYIDSCKYQTLSNSKIIVNRDELDELVNDLKHCIPEEIKKYQRIIANRDAILKDAQDKAEEMMKKANEMTIKLVSEHEIMQKAYAEANAVVNEANSKGTEIVNQAQAEANEIKVAAIQYTDDSLQTIQNILTTSIESFSSNYGSLMEALQSNLNVTNANRQQLHPNAQPGGYEASGSIDDSSFDEGLDDYYDEDLEEDSIYSQGNRGNADVTNFLDEND